MSPRYEPVYMRKAMLIHAKIGTRGSIPALSEYTGKALGSGHFYDGPVAACQMACALSLSRHPLVEGILGHKGSLKKDFDAAPLVESRVLSGMRILDLGCGKVPSFARCARALGAEVFAVDLRGAEHFVWAPGRATSEAVRAERECRMRLDLDLPDASRWIEQASGGGFDITAEANLAADGCFSGRTVGLRLLRQGGLHYEAPGPEALRLSGG